MFRRLLLPLCLAGVCAAASPSYFRDIRPILQRQCQGCHQPAMKSSGLDLTAYEGLLSGGKRGASVQPEAGADSLLVKYLTGAMKPQMPLGSAPLPADQVESFRQWIASGAKDDTPAEARDTVSLDKPPVYHQPPVVTALAYSPDGRTLAVSGYREVLLHKSDGSEIQARLLGVSERLLSLGFSADGATLMAAGGTPARFGEVQFWNVETAKLRRSITLTNDTVFGASLTPDGKVAAVGCADNSVRILQTSSGKELYKIGNHENWVLGTVFGIDGKRLVSIGKDRAAKLTDATAGQFLENVNLLRGELMAVARHPKKDVIVIGGEDRTPFVYQMDRPRNMKIADDSTLLRKLEAQSGPIFALAYSPDGARIAVAGASPEVRIYDAETGQRVSVLKGHPGAIYALAFRPDGEQIATGGFDGRIRLYRASTGELVKEFVPVPLEAKP